MGGYVANFMVYTMAMIGLICFAVFVYKKFTDGTMRTGENKFLSIEGSMSLSPRKTLHIVRAGNEKFLIASDVERTTLISKLGGVESSGGKYIGGKYIEQAAVQSQKFEQRINPESEYDYKYESLPEISVAPEPQRQPELKPQYQTQTPVVHLEPIRPKAQAPQPRPRMDRRAGQPAYKTVTLDFDTPKKHGFSTMKEMAMKINEL